MCQLKLWLFVLGVAVTGAVGKSLRTVGGHEVSIEEYPHQISLIYQGRHYCGGSIISEQFVLTAAHCVNQRNARDFHVRAGSSYRTRGGNLYKVASITQHPQFNNISLDYDIAVIRTAKSIVINGVTTDVIRLADHGKKLSSGEPMTVTGWGDTTSSGNPSNVLNAITVPVLDKEQCSLIWRSLAITDRMVCAGSMSIYQEQTSCKGDSGGAMIDNNYVQYGIVSFVHKMGCQVRPPVFASVATLRHWIQQHTGV